MLFKIDLSTGCRSIEFDTGAGPFKVESPILFAREFDPATLTTFQFVFRYDVKRWELVGVKVWESWRDALRDPRRRGTPVTVILDPYGPTEIVRDTLTLSAIDLINAHCMLITRYPSRSERWLVAWARKLMAGNGQDGDDALRIGHLAACGMNGSNPEERVAVERQRVSHPADVAAYRAEINR